MFNTGGSIMAGPSQGRGKSEKWDIKTHAEDNRLLMHAQLLLIKEFVNAMQILREEYVKRGLDKELEFQ